MIKWISYLAWTFESSWWWSPLTTPHHPPGQLLTRHNIDLVHRCGGRYKINDVIQDGDCLLRHGYYVMFNTLYGVSHAYG